MKHSIFCKYSIRLNRCEGRESSNDMSKPMQDKLKESITELFDNDLMHQIDAHNIFFIQPIIRHVHLKKKVKIKFTYMLNNFDIFED